ncbi:dedicator of cytokinesis protein 1 isoform X5 [Harmonia axyridis]|uniref:dedicator of cytokinesis protein 1 isoform X5 n=1 Tax=Harmonia axyridis TaxID=115357 RepID=UPI001E275E78|nr:dedicator of cytokinesis protein 1 isoform X5 [Harmonia axyridis]
MSVWQTVPEERSYGIAIYNFQEEGEFKLKLTVGDAVHIIEQEENWYIGYAVYNRHVQGIFPKNYIHIKPCTVDLSGSLPNFVLKEPPIAQEITTVLREWNNHWKNLYVTHNKNFEQIKTQIYDLINHRSKIISGTLPVDELKRVTKEATEDIDMGNKILNLDLAVRDNNGNLINPEETSTIQLYFNHKNAVDRMSKCKTEQNHLLPKTAIQQYSNIFLVAIKNFTCKMNEDAQLLITLYDGREYKSITENYVVRWSKDGLMSDLDQMHNLRVMFTDLGKKDLEREKIYLVCYVVRVGAMEVKEVDHRRSSNATTFNRKSSADNMRRPFGVAAMEITKFMKGGLESDFDKEYPIQFVGCEKDNLEQTLKKIISKDFAKNDNKNQALFVSMKLLRGDLKQVREEHPHLVLGNVSLARKMGFPEVILPGDIRNDLYITLVSGEFTKGNKSSDKNVEVTVTVCNENGGAIPGVISLGGGVLPMNEYKSVIYYHEDKPQWFETFKVAIPIEEFKTSHLKFTFKHRSSNEAKDKSEKPFAMSFVRLMEENGTTLSNVKHNLIVYKIDHKKFEDQRVEYLKLASNETEIKEGPKIQVSGLSVSAKDYFIISSNICSTKLTQNVKLLGLLNWAAKKECLNQTLQSLMEVDGEEVVKLLQDILDALFNILMDHQETDTYDTLVFECLLHIISLVSSDWKYQHFEPVLALYIKEGFSATLAYKKLISVLNKIITRSVHTISKTRDELVFKTMKSLQHVMRFISRSRILYLEVNPEISPEDEFRDSLLELLDNIIHMMSSTQDSMLREQGACLKFLPSTINDLLLVFNYKELSEILCEMLRKIPVGRLTKQKMMTVNDIVHSQLFLYPECRRIMLPVFTEQIKILLETNEEVELCIKILSDILKLLHRKNIGNTFDDIQEIIKTDLRTAIQTHIHMHRENPHDGNLVAIMIDIFRQMTETHYTNYINNFQTKYDILDFLMEILVVFQELVSNPVFPTDWCEMIMLQNSVILKSLRFFSHTIRDYYFEKFEYQAWNNFFHCAIAFMTQPALQLEAFSNSKRLRIIKRYKDMRRETGFEIRSMWFNLGQYKAQFVPGLVGLVLEMTLLPEPELRKATIPIFFDMMQCEFYSSKYVHEGYGDTKRDSSHVKGNFKSFENEMIAKLDTLVEGGRGDEEYKNMFHDILRDLCSQHTTMKEEGIKFVETVTKLMERLLEYRCIIIGDNKENKMSCTVNLLEFYSEIERQEMYIRYLNKLYDLHLSCDNFTEAAFTLELHAKLLNWSDKELGMLLKSTRHEDCSTHRQLKETLYYNIIDNYDKGKMWECAIQKCHELAKQYEEETFDYEQLSNIYKRIATFYDDIIKNVRLEPEYFRVGYYGKGFPQFLQNNVLIYRGKEYERLADFNSRILNEFPKAELLNKLTPPGPDITESDKQYIQINKVDPVMDESKQKRLSGKPLSEQILKYYQVNNIRKFTFSRPLTRKDPNLEIDNEFASLWLERTELIISHPLPGILRWFPIINVEVHEISPLLYAIETIEKANRKLRNYIVIYNRDRNIQINPLSLTLTGILYPNVMGGIKNYEETFFTEAYSLHNPQDEHLVQKLKDLIANQIPLLELCVQIHKDCIPSILQPLQDKLESRFTLMKEDVVKKYGKAISDIKIENSVTMRKQSARTNHLNTDISSVNDSFGGRSRVSSLTRNQVTSLKQLTSSFNFSNSPTSNRKNHFISRSANSTKSLLSPSKNTTPTPSLTHKKSHKTPKEKRRSSKSEIHSPIGNGTQWYTGDNEINNSTNGMAPFELTQELTPKRPLRSEVEREKRLSRPPSGQFGRPISTNSILRGASSSGASSNRDSVGTTDSSISEEDIIPPPIPIKLRSEINSDYCNLENSSFLYSSRNSTRNTINNIQLPVVSDSQSDNDVPPIPPPKPPKNKTKSVIL